MTKEQRYRYEMFVRVRDYGTAHHDLFPESSAGGESFAQVAAAVARIDEHLTSRVIARADARRVKATTRAAVFDGMKAMALAARRVTRPEPGESPFRMPQRRSLTAELSTARAFISEAGQRQDQFARFGLPPAFISEFGMLVDQLQEAVDTRLSSKTVRRQAQAGIETLLAGGLEVIRDLDAIVTIATRQDPIRFAAWRAARRIEGQGTTRFAKVTLPAVVPATTPVEPVVLVPEAAAVPSSPEAEPPVVATGDVMGRAS